MSTLLSGSDRGRRRTAWVKGGWRRQADGAAGLPSAPEMPGAPGHCAWCQSRGEQASQAVADHRREIFNDPSTPVGGNPQGNETIVEFFDYRCPYCKRVEPSVDAMLRQDPNLRLVYKEFPILGPVSVTAAYAALAAQRQGEYDAFHAAMMEAHGNITDDTVYRVAASLGLDIDKLKRDMASPEFAQQIRKNLKLADALGIRGTPAFVIGDKVVPGAADIATLKSMVADAHNK